MRSALIVLSGCLTATLLWPAITHGDRLPARVGAPMLVERPVLAPVPPAMTRALATPAAIQQPGRQLQLQGAVSSCGTVHTQQSSRFSLTGGCVPVR